MLKIVNKFRFFLIIIILLSIILLIGLFFYAKYQISVPLNQDGEEQAFTINQGQGLKEIAQNLEQEGLIRGKTWFLSYILFRGWAAQMQAGEYTLNPSLSIIQISNKIFNGDVIPSDVAITIPEGFTLKQIDARLAANNLINPGELLNNPELEGYLFPDTYEFNKDDSLDEIIVEMMDNFSKKLDEDLLKEIERQGKKIKDIIIMASILEKEVPAYSDRQIVSGIFWDRIDNNYPLQSCATIAYILDIDKWIYSIEDTEIESEYNTYKNIGLPPGPINNPGLSAIKAAVYPIDTDYYFFLSAPDGQTIFSRTFEEHKENKEKYLR